MEDYAGMHQHNFTARNGRFIIWNRQGEIDVAQALGDAVEIEAGLYGETISALVKRGVAVTIRKVASTTIHDAADYYRHRVSSLLEAVIRQLAAAPMGAG